MIHFDFETRSRVNLLTRGTYVYAMDPSTEILMLAGAVDDAEPELWFPGQPFPAEWRQRIGDGEKIAAFNAQFERLLMWYVLCPDFDVPEPPLEQFYCVATQARANGLPGNLADCALAIDSTHKKDFRGAALIKIFCVPNADGAFNDVTTHPEEWQEFCDYCLQDVRVERDICRMLRALTPVELEDYYVNEIINDRGLLIDRDLAAAAVTYATDEQQDLTREIQHLTGMDKMKTRGTKLTDFIYTRLPAEAQRHMHVWKKGVRKLTFSKDARERLLVDDSVQGPLRQVIEYADFAQASSTSKFASMGMRADPETDRVCGSYIMNGAGTGRYSSRGLQMHNHPRMGLKNADEVRLAMLEQMDVEVIENNSGYSIMQALKGLLRHSIMAAPGHAFVCGDWEQIEGRVNPWLSIGVSPMGDWQARQKLAMYADPDIDVYCELASDILGERIEPDDDVRRQAYGKVPELSMSFGGGVGAFQSMAAGYGVSMLDEEAEQIKVGWRIANPWAPPWWKALHTAAVAAYNTPGVAQVAGRIAYLYQEDFLQGTLWCLLPSQRLLCYPHAVAEWKENKFGSMSWCLSAMKAAWTPKQGETAWPRVDLWPGLLCENVTQAAAADVLRESLAELVLHCKAPVVGHTHDEILEEVPLCDVEQRHAEMLGVMNMQPSWGDELPLATQVWTGPRYRK